MPSHSAAHVLTHLITSAILLLYTIPFFVALSQNLVKEFFFWGGELRPVWSEWARYGTLGQSLKPLAKINLPKSPTFLGNVCKGVKTYHCSSEIIFGQLLQTFGDFFLVTLVGNEAKFHSTLDIRFLDSPLPASISHPPLNIKRTL